MGFDPGFATARSGLPIVTRMADYSLFPVMPGLVPGIHVLECMDSKTWMAGT